MFLSIFPHTIFLYFINLQYKGRFFLSYFIQPKVIFKFRCLPLCRPRITHNVPAASLAGGGRCSRHKDTSFPLFTVSVEIQNPACVKPLVSRSPFFFD
jgi:hypothetical protein